MSVSIDVCQALYCEENIKKKEQGPSPKDHQNLWELLSHKIIYHHGYNTRILKF